MSSKLRLVVISNVEAVLKPLAHSCMYDVSSQSFTRNGPVIVGDDAFRVHILFIGIISFFCCLYMEAVSLCADIALATGSDVSIVLTPQRNTQTITRSNPDRDRMTTTNIYVQSIWIW
jgi:hypothetical protein